MHEYEIRSTCGKRLVWCHGARWNGEAYVAKCEDGRHANRVLAALRARHPRIEWRAFVDGNPSKTP